MFHGQKSDVTESKAYLINLLEREGEDEEEDEDENDNTDDNNDATNSNSSNSNNNNNAASGDASASKDAIADVSNHIKDDALPSAEDLNEMLARSEEEFELFEVSIVLCVCWGGC